MSASMEVTNKSVTDTLAALQNVRVLFPKEAYRAVIQIAFKVKKIAQEKIKSDGHIVTSRLRNSIFVDSKDKRQTSNANNRIAYSDNKGNTFSAGLSVPIYENEVAVGTNVVYAEKIEKLDSYIEYGAETVDADPFLKAAQKRVGL